MQDIVKLALVFYATGRKVKWLDGCIRAAGREFTYDDNGIVVKVKEVGK